MRRRQIIERARVLGVVANGKEIPGSNSVQRDGTRLLFSLEPPQSRRSADGPSAVIRSSCNESPLPALFEGDHHIDTPGPKPPVGSSSMLHCGFIEPAIARCGCTTIATRYTWCV